MPKYIFTYRRSHAVDASPDRVEASSDSAPAAEARAAWTAFFEAIGPSAVDPGQPVFQRTNVGEVGTDRRRAGMKGTYRMTDAEQPSATPADPSADYQRTIRVKAHPGALFDALTSVCGLAAWWTRVTGSGDAGGELKFFMNSPDPCVMHVDQATRPTSVQWTVTACNFLPDWVGTRPTFTITPVDGDATELHFRHKGLTPELECIEQCTRGWDHFLASFREYVEVGRGGPHGSDADRARRVRELHDYE